MGSRRWVFVGENGCRGRVPFLTANAHAQVPPEFCEGISARWRCELVPTATTEEEIRQHVLDGTPVLVPAEYGKRACEQVGDDALEYLTGDPERNEFPRPKIAYVAQGNAVLAKPELPYGALVPPGDLSTACKATEDIERLATRVEKANKTTQPPANGGK